MSKKSRKKSATKTTAAKAKTSAKASAKPSVRKASKAVAKKTAKKAAGPAKKTPAKPLAKSASKTDSKTLKPAAGTSSATSSASAKPKAAAKASKIAALTEGASAPAFRLPGNNGATISLADYAGQKLVIFFYPRADTPGCTREAIDFTRLSGDFTAAKTALLGVSADPMKAQESFKKKHTLSMPLMSDETHTMLKSYGAWGEKSMYGKTFEGVLRTTVLIGTDGKIAKIWSGVKVDGHADEVLEAARSA